MTALAAPATLPRRAAPSAAPRARPTSQLETWFAQQCVAAGLPTPVRELRFHPTRRFRFDFAWPEHLLAVEIDGAVWINGRHNRGAGFLRDQEKMNLAQSMGWTVLHFSRATLKSGDAVRMTGALLAQRMAA